MGIKVLEHKQREFNPSILISFSFLLARQFPATSAVVYASFIQIMQGILTPDYKESFLRGKEGQVLLSQIRQIRSETFQDF